MFAEDLDVFLNPEEMATQAILWPGQDNELAILAVFGQSPAEGNLGGARVSSPRPWLICRADQVAQAAQGTPLHLPANARLGILEADYTVITSQPQAGGLVLLHLQARR